MASPYIGEIRMFGGNFNPQNWALCNGQLIAISQNEALFALIGTTYGGDGVNTFGLPNLQGRVPIHQGSNSGSSYVAGQPGGEENHLLTLNELPAHNHAVAAASSANSSSPSSNLYASGGPNLYKTSAPGTPMNAGVIASGGSSQAHSNLMPYLCVSFIIALYGIFPSRS